MKTLSDLLNLITQEIELNENKMVNFVFDIDTRYNRIAFNKLYPEVKNKEFTGKDTTEKILDIRVKTPASIQEAYWIIYNNGRVQDANKFK